jgi:cell division protein FtsI/penicillin-binding protein 2
MSNPREGTIDARRLTALVVVFVLSISAVIFRLVWFQVLKHPEIVGNVEEQLTREVLISAQRGYIADVRGHLLALNRIEWNVSVSPNVVRNPEKLAHTLSGLLGIAEEELVALLEAHKDDQWLPLVNGVDMETGEALLALKEEEPALVVESVARRFYPEGSLFAHLLGIVNFNGDGFYGTEGYYNLVLKGKDGVRIVRVGPDKTELPVPPLSVVPPVHGSSLVLTLDRNIQFIAEQELLQALMDYGAESGTVVIMDPTTGGLLAAVSYPSYDPNAFIDTEAELLANPAVSSIWEPGSIFKVITWAGGLDAGVITPVTPFYDAGALEVGGRIIQNSDRESHGTVTATEGLVQSLNTVAAEISGLMGKGQFYTYLRRFGFGTYTNIDLQSEEPGMMKQPGDSNWFPSELGTNSFGQGIAVTPVQMVVAVSAVANQGRMMKPHIVDAFVKHDNEGGPDEVARVEPMVVRNAVSPEAAQAMVEMMMRVVEDGSVEAQVPGYGIAGKTGTAQIPAPYGYEEEDTIASFIGFAPADDPQFIVLVKLDRPSSSTWGSRTAAPTFRAIAERLFAYMQIPPDEIRLASR